MKALSLVLSLVATTTFAQATDLPPPPAIGQIGLQPYLGLWSGVSISNTTNTVVSHGSIITEFPTVGPTTGVLGGLNGGLGWTFGRIYAGAELSAGYDAGSQCYGPNCAAERHPGILLQETIELGYWIRPNFMLAAVPGLAQRANNICAFDLPALAKDCGTGFVYGYSVGGRAEYVLDRNWSVFVAWDHVWWSRYSASTPAGEAPGFSNTIAIDHEDLLRFGAILRF